MCMCCFKMQYVLMCYMLFSITDVYKILCLMYLHTLIAEGRLYCIMNTLSHVSRVSRNIMNRSRDVKSRWGTILNISKSIAKHSNFTNARCLVVRSFYNCIRSFSFRLPKVLEALEMQPEHVSQSP